MSAFSVADAKNTLPGLIDRALGGEEVVITRHGRPVVEIRPVSKIAASQTRGTYEWLRARRDSRPGIDITSVELLNRIYEGDAD